MDQVLNGARARKAKELVQQHVRREPDAVTLIDELLAKAGMSIHDLVADELRKSSLFDYIERIDRLAAITESRRNACLREIDRRRAVLGEALRRRVQEIEEAELQVIEATTSEGKNAA